MFEVLKHAIACVTASIMFVLTDAVEILLPSLYWWAESIKSLHLFS